MKTLDDPCAWPGGARCAVAITFDCDADSVLHCRGLEAASDPLTVSWLHYEQVAVPKIVQMYDELGIKQTFFVPAWCIERYPDTYEPIVASGHEIGHHGYLHETPTDQTADGEAHWFERSTEILENFSGKRPVGYRAPNAGYNVQTIDLLIEQGFLYDSCFCHQNNPYFFRTSLGQMIELPLDIFLLEDWSQYSGLGPFQYRHHPSSPNAAADVYMAEFEAIYEAGGLFMTCFHPNMTGRPGRLRRLRQMLEYMQEKGDVWFATLEEIATHIKAVSDSGEHEPRVIDWPLYPPGRTPELQAGYVSDELAIRVPGGA
jgi:peptidoglycan/xylan/chitin deacetylase (PgdA/CDA1 family)